MEAERPSGSPPRSKKDKRYLYSQGECLSVELDHAQWIFRSLLIVAREKILPKKFCCKLQYPLDSDLSYAIDSVMYCLKNEQGRYYEQVYYNCWVNFNFVIDCHPIFKRYHPIVCSFEIYNL